MVINFVVFSDILNRILFRSLSWSRTFNEEVARDNHGGHPHRRIKPVGLL